ncbi:hypothetical protein [Chitinimonas prasina]|uniref:hypothetical protein n=1 Tax=Chitinimonas prasina TaxID=1434937 RepID=UPI0024E0FBB9|nr:hypothetical protein [Chitinimonas prasina]
MQKNPTHSKRDLEQLIFDVAEHQADKDFRELYAIMRGKQVFVPIDRGSIPAAAAAGEQYVTTANDCLKMQYVIGPNGQFLIPSATSEDSPIVQNGYVGMDWTAFLQMVAKLDSSFFGALLQGKTSWVAFDRDRINYILGGTWDRPIG